MGERFGEAIGKVYIVTGGRQHRKIHTVPFSEAKLDFDCSDLYDPTDYLAQRDLTATISLTVANDSEVTKFFDSLFIRRDSGFPEGESQRRRYRDRLPKKVMRNGDIVTCVWNDGTHTMARCHDGDEFDLDTGILVCALKKWMPGFSYWLHASGDCRVDDVQERRVRKKIRKAKYSTGLEPCSEIDIEPAPAPEIKAERKHKTTDPYHRGLAYSDDEKLEALEMMEGGLTQSEVSKRTGIAQSTLSNWKREYRGPGKDNCRD